MKAAFNIIPSETPNGSLNLLVEIGEHGVYFIWFTKDPISVKGLSFYNLNETNTLADIKTIFNSLDSLLSGLSSVTVCYDFKQSLLIPASYHEEMIIEKALSLVYGDDNNVALNNDLVTSAQVYVHYRVPSGVGAFIEERFPKGTIFHSTSLQLELLNNSQNLLYCIFYHNSLKLILYKEGKLQVVQQFNYTSPQDAAYHLLNTCEQFALKPASVNLRLSGMVDAHSKLYAELHNYFLNIEFEKFAEAISIPNEMKELPNHFFSHLISLAVCVS